MQNLRFWVVSVLEVGFGILIALWFDFVFLSNWVEIADFSFGNLEFCMV